MSEVTRRAEMCEERINSLARSTGLCNYNKTVMVKMSSTFSNIKMSIAKILSKYAMESSQSVLFYVILLI